MSNQDPAPLDADIELLLRAERPLDAPPHDLAARALARVHRQIALMGPGVGPGGSDGSGGGDAGGSTGAGAGAGAGGWSGLARPIASLSAALLIGGAIGGLVHAVATKPTVVYVDREVAAPPARPAPSSSSVAPEAAVTQPPAVTVAPALRPAPSDVRPSPMSTGDQLAAERALLDVARSAVGEGNGARALEAVARHEKQFPTGLLVEEREALAIRSLVLVDRAPEARVRAAAFERRFPNSLALAGIRASLDATR